MSVRLAVIDPSISDYATLLAGLDPATEVFILDPSADGWQQLADRLAGRSDIAALDLYSHGSAGSLQLGSSTLSSANLPDYATLLAQIGSHLTADADVMLYGCNVGTGVAGQSFIDQFAQLTGADVAASTDLTGAAALGGDWVLEAQSTGAVIDTPATAVEGLAGALASNQAPVALVSGIQDITRISTSGDGTQGNLSSIEPVFSPDGSKVVFTSYASNLIASDTNGYSDIFVKDLATGAVTRISTAADGTQGDFYSIDPVFSPDGSKVAFTSYDSNLEAGDTNWSFDIFVKDLATNAVTRVSTTADGTQGNGVSDSPAFSPDGSQVAFRSTASNLVAGDTNGLTDIFVKNLATGAVTRVSTTADGTQANSESASVVFSPDGSKVAFASDASNLVAGDTYGVTDIFVKDLATGAVTRISTTADGTQGGNGISDNPVFSPDGSKIAFESSARNLVGGDSNFSRDIFVKDLVTGAVTLITKAVDGVQGDSSSFSPVFSPDGSKVAFMSYASNLVAGDTNGFTDIFVKDLVTGAVTRVSTTSGVTQGDGNSLQPVFSPDGSQVAFMSFASNLVSGDTNNTPDIFVATLARQSGPEDTAQVYELRGSDVDGTVASFKLSTQPSHGALYLDAALTQLVSLNTVIPADGNVATLYFKPEANWNGSTSFSFVATDNQGAVSEQAALQYINVVGVNDAPALTGAAATLPAGMEDKAYTLRASDLLTGWSDVEGSPLSVTALSVDHGTLADNHDGTWTFTPAFNYAGTVHVSYGVSDGSATTAATRAFDLASVNDAPIAGGGFVTARAFSVYGTRPQGVALADFNGDGHLDAVTSDFGTNTVSLLFGLTGNTVGLVNAFQVGAEGPAGVAVGDVNADGKMDIVTANTGSDNVSVLLGAGAGVLQPARTYPLNDSYPWDIKLADVTGDGKLDIVTTNYTSNQVSVLAGSGTGSFATAQTYAVNGSNPYNLEVADLNADGRLDIVTTDVGSNHVSVLTGKAGGGFNAAVTYAVNGNSPSGLALGDVNGDGLADIVTANAGSNTVSVLTGKAGGGFNTAVAYAVNGITPYDVALGDVNVDGRLDIVTTDNASNRISVLAGQAGGGFGFAQPYAVNGTGPFNLVMADLNGDGQVDIVTSDAGSNQISVLRNANPLILAGGEDFTHLVTLRGSDVDGTVASFRISGLPAHGTVYADAALTQVVTAATVIAATGNQATVYFKPEANWNGSTTLAYTAVDDQGAVSLSAATQRIDIVPMNDAPVLSGTAAVLAAGQEDAAYTFSTSDLLTGWTDPEGSAVSMTGLSANHGSLTDNGNGTWTFTPEANYSGTVTLSYSVSDGTAATATTLSFNLGSDNDTPTAGGGASSASGAEDSVLTLTLSGSDTDGQVTSFRVTALPANGTLFADAALTQAVTSATVISAASQAATLYFKPTANWSGATSLSYIALDNDGAASANVATQSITVTAVNDAPALTGTAATLPAGTADTPYTISAANLLAGWTDVENDAISISTLTATHGSLVNNGNGTWTFTPEAGYSGAVSLNYTVTDVLGAGTAAALGFTLTGGSTVYSSVTTTLPADKLNLVLTGTAAINGTGNALANQLTGNSASNTLTGLAGNDSLDGGAGADSMVGGKGNDSYWVDNTADKVVERSGEGSDTVCAALDHTLAANVENLVLTGSAINGTGNTLANTLTGNALANSLSGGAGNDTVNGGTGNDTLDGGAGSDKLSGGLGDDRYVVDSSSDMVTEAANEGLDTVWAGVTWTLGANVENLVLTGSAAKGSGNALDNRITGNGAANTLAGAAGNDTLAGGLGKDSLSGGAGLDQFVFDTAPAAGNVDTVSDFVSGTDRLVLAAAVFSGTGLHDSVLTASMLRVGAGITKAGDADDHLMLNSSTGALYYDADGLGGTAAVQIAVLTGVKSIVASDIFIQG